jgi:hypothetical protein
MLAQGKTPKEQVDTARCEPVADIPEGSEAQQAFVTRPVRAEQQSVFV